MKKSLLIAMATAVLLLGVFFGNVWAGAGDPVLEPITIDEIESTDRSGSDGTLITGTAGTDTYVAVWNADGDLVDGPGVPYVVGGTDVADDDVVDTLTITNISQVQDITATASEINTPLDGALVTLAEFQQLETLGATTISANQWAVLGGIAETLTYTELDLLDGMSKSGADLSLITGTAGASGNVAAWNADGDIVDGGAGGSPGSFGAGSAQTVATGIIDASAGANYVIVSGEGDAADAVTEIQGATAGDIIVFKGKTGLAYNITFTDGAYLELQADFIMNNEADTITLICTTLGANDIFTEIARASNG